MRRCPVADRDDELLWRVGLHVGAGALDDHGLVLGEGRFQALALLGTEPDLGVTPHDQCRQVGEVRKAGFDLGEESPAGGDLAGEYGGGLAPLGVSSARR
jgi:small ligand-binding sensory domain FIST